MKKDEELIKKLMNQAGFSEEHYDGEIRQFKHLQINDYILTGGPSNEARKIEAFWSRVRNIGDNSYSFIYEDGKEYWVPFDPEKKVLVIREKKN